MNSDLPEGFEIPIHRSIAERMMMGGLPRELCFVYWTISAGIVFGLRALWSLPVFFIIHLWLVNLHKKDDFFYEVIKKALHAPKRLEP